MRVILLIVALSIVLIGASALQVHLPLNRNTRDLDVTVAADLGEFTAGLDRLSGWRRHATRERDGRVRARSVWTSSQPARNSDARDGIQSA